jgi:t-SNARE complex subunit (syntaxin)
MIDRLASLKGHATYDETVGVTIECATTVDDVTVHIRSLANAVEEAKVNRNGDICVQFQHVKRMIDELPNTVIRTTVSRKYNEILCDYQRWQIDSRSKMMATVKRQIQVVEPNASDERIHEIIQSGNVDKIYRDKILSTTNGEVRNAVADIQCKYNDILTLETSIKQLATLFTDMTMIVNSNGEILDSIEYNVIQATNNVKKGESQLTDAKKHTKQSRKRTCALLATVVVCTGLITGGVVAKRTEFF